MSESTEIETLPGPAKGLLRLLEEAGERECADLRRDGERKVTELRRQAFARARQRVHQAVGDERKRMAQSLARVEAEIETARRQRILAHAAGLVKEGRELLREALLERWQQPAARKLWVSALIQAAGRVVIARDWRMECPADWPEEERAGAIELAAAACGASLEVQARDSIEAGLRLVSGGVSLDMRVDGLLADTAGIDSDLLGLYRDHRAGERS